LVGPLSDYFNGKLDRIREEIASLPATEKNPERIGTPAVLDVLSPVTDVKVSRMIAHMLAEAGRADYFPTCLLKKFSFAVVPIIVKLEKKSFRTGVFPFDFKHAIVTPI